MIILLLVILASVASAQTPTRLTLAEAEALAVKNNPSIPAALLSAQAAAQIVTEARAANFPSFYGNLTSAGALNNSRIAAGGLNNPVIFNRVSTGLTVGQLITDFGRTANLTESARLRARSEQENARATRAEVVLRVDRAYFGVLRSIAVLHVAEQTVAARKVLLDQVTALAASQLKSGLDVSFAKVSLSDAQLLLLGAQNDRQAAMAEFSAAVGLRNAQEFQLSEEETPPALGKDPAPFLDSALRARPELASLRLRRDAAYRFAEAEKDLARPTIGALGATGLTPLHDEKLENRYSAVGVNVSIPIFNGKLFTARHEEAVLRAKSLDENIRSAEDQVMRDVRVAWLAASTSFERLDVTRQLLDQATQSLELAQGRYDLGLSSIVELNLAQLSKTAAEIGVASAKYDYQMLRAFLDYQAGNTRP